MSDFFCLFPGFICLFPLLLVPHHVFFISAGYNVVIVESVGLGQSEVEIDNAVDMLIMIVPPGGGDGLQVKHTYFVPPQPEKR